VAASTSSACLVRLSIRPSASTTRRRKAGGRAGQRRSAKGDERPFWPWRQQRGWPAAPVWAHEPGRLAYAPHRWAVEKEMGTRQLFARGRSPARRQGPEGFTAGQQTDRGGQPAPALGWTWPQKGPPSRGPHPLATPRPPSQWRPPRGTSPHWQWPRQPFDLLTPGRRQALVPCRHGLGGLRALSRPAWPLRRPEPVALANGPTSPRKPNAVPKALDLASQG